MCRGLQEERRLPGGGVVWLQSMASKTGGKKKIKHLERCLGFYLDSLKPCLLKINYFFSHTLTTLTFKTIFCILSLLSKLCIN